MCPIPQGGDGRGFFYAHFSISHFYCDLPWKLAEWHILVWRGSLLLDDEQHFSPFVWQLGFLQSNGSSRESSGKCFPWIAQSNDAGSMALNDVLTDDIFVNTLNQQDLMFAGMDWDQSLCPFKRRCPRNKNIETQKLDETPHFLSYVSIILSAIMSSSFTSNFSSFAANFNGFFFIFLCFKLLKFIFVVQ